ncbi:eukaryotic translation initiation factor eIF2A-domain-containing protein [Mycena rebaudengoi]|nr:eukaryotic translation initiation factor eIF2A-domain-containing protein [Mycena rebaudengoi]
MLRATLPAFLCSTILLTLSAGKRAARYSGYDDADTLIERRAPSFLNAGDAPATLRGPHRRFRFRVESEDFDVVYGFRPAKTMLFDRRVRTIYDFSASSHNFIPFTPQGRLIALAGFGSLACKTDIFDRPTFSKVCTIDAPNTSYCASSPDGRFLLTATFHDCALTAEARYGVVADHGRRPGVRRRAEAHADGHTGCQVCAVWTNEHRIPPLHPHSIHARGPNRASTTFPPFALRCAETPVDSTHPTTSSVRRMYARMGDHKQDTDTDAPRPHIGDTPRSRSRRSHSAPHPARAAQPRSARTPLAAPSTKAHPDAPAAWLRLYPRGRRAAPAPAPFLSLKSTPQHSSRGNDSRQQDAGGANRHLQDVYIHIPKPAPAPPPDVSAAHTYRQAPAGDTDAQDEQGARAVTAHVHEPPLPPASMYAPSSSNTGGQQKTCMVAARISAHGVPTWVCPHAAVRKPYLQHGTRDIGEQLIVVDDGGDPEDVADYLWQASS